MEMVRRGRGRGSMAESAPSLDTDCLNELQPTSPKRPKNKELRGLCLVREIEVGAHLEPCWHKYS